MYAIILLLVYGYYCLLAAANHHDLPSCSVCRMVIPPASPLFKHVSGVVPPIQFQASSTAGSKQLAKLAASMEMLSQLAGVRFSPVYLFSTLMLMRLCCVDLGH